MAAEAASASRFHDVEGARGRHGAELVDRMIESVFQTDEAADELVAAIVANPRDLWPALDRALEYGPEAVPGAPEVLRRFAAEATALPDWVDLELLDRGAVAFWRVGALLQLISLTAGALSYGYTTSFARPLLITGRLEKMAPRRLAETASWVITATKPGALHPGRPGVRASIRIRVVHALVRRRIVASGDWNETDWGVPLSIGDTLATGIIGFYAYPVSGLRRLGVRYSQDELEAMCHLWSYVSWLMGVPAPLLPRTAGEAFAYAAAGYDLDSATVPGSEELMAALLRSSALPADLLPGPLANVVNRGFGAGVAAVARDWMGDERADSVAIPRTAARHLVLPALRAAVWTGELARALPLAPSDQRLVAIDFALRGALARLGRPRPSLAPGDL